MVSTLDLAMFFVRKSVIDLTSPISASLKAATCKTKATFQFDMYIQSPKVSSTLFKVVVIEQQIDPC